MCVPRRILRFPVSLSVPLPHQLGGFGCPCPPLPLGPGRSMVGGCFHPMIWGSSDVPPTSSSPPPLQGSWGVLMLPPHLRGPLVPPPFWGSWGVFVPVYLRGPSSSCPPILGVPLSPPRLGGLSVSPSFWGSPCPSPPRGFPCGAPGVSSPSISFLLGVGGYGEPSHPQDMGNPPGVEGWSGRVGGGAAGGSGWGGGRAL